MDDDVQSNLESDLLGTVVKPPSIRVSRSFRGTSFNRSTPHGSPSARRLSSVKTPRKEPQANVVHNSWASRCSTRRLIPWLVLLGVWSYVGSYVLFRKPSISENYEQDAIMQVSDSLINSHGEESISSANTGTLKRPEMLSSVKTDPDSHFSRPVFSIENRVSNWLRRSSMGKGGSRAQKNASKVQRDDSLHADQTNRQTVENAMQFQEANRSSRTTDNIRDVRRDASFQKEDLIDAQSQTFVTYKKLFGPFNDLENAILQSRTKPNICTQEGSFLRAIRGKYIVLVIHELSMTGAPWAMIELGTETLNCGGKVAAVVLSKQGGLLSELSKRRIPVIKGKSVESWKEAAKADLVVAGSAVCAGWIDSFITSNKGVNHIVWWVMENRREYFDRSKGSLGSVNALIFLSELQFQQWHEWCKAEGLTLPSKISVIGLSVNDDILTAAGLISSSDSKTDGPEDYQVKRKRLRHEVRKAIGVEPNDTLFISLSSINPGKGQLLMLEAASLVAEGGSQSSKIQTSSVKVTSNKEGGISMHRKALTRLFPNKEAFTESGNDGSSHSSRTNRMRQLLAESQRAVFSLNNKSSGASADGRQSQLDKSSMKILIGSVFSKSNKLEYVQKMMDFLKEHPVLAAATVWTPASVHVASLYIAADAYVINSQGIGETFGRVTIEAMAFGLPVLGTDAGGTREIVIANVTGLLHPVGNLGIPVLANHIDFLLNHPQAGRAMGERGKERVQNLFTKSVMYEKLGAVFLRSLK